MQENNNLEGGRGVVREYSPLVKDNAVGLPGKRGGEAESGMRVDQ